MKKIMYPIRIIEILRAECFFKQVILIVVLFLTVGTHVKANDQPFQAGEELNYTIYFKYGFVMARAGSAEYRLKQGTYRSKQSICSQLSFKTTSAFDKIYKVRDTLRAHADQSTLRPFYHEKFLHESKTNYVEEMVYLNHGPQFSKVRSIRKTAESVKFDTLLFSNSVGYDMVSIFMFARTLKFETLQIGQVIPIASFVGRDVVQMKIKYAGQSILEKSETEKYKTLKFDIDIIDQAFETSKNALEIWISDDKNRVPVKIRAKLKIGAAEAELTSHKNLKYPLDSRIVIQRK